MQILSHSSHHNMVKDKAILKGAKTSTICTNAVILTTFISKSEKVETTVLTVCGLKKK